MKSSPEGPKKSVQAIVQGGWPLSEGSVQFEGGEKFTHHRYESQKDHWLGEIINAMQSDISIMHGTDACAFPWSDSFGCEHRPFYLFYTLILIELNSIWLDFRQLIEFDQNKLEKDLEEEKQGETAKEQKGKRSSGGREWSKATKKKEIEYFDCKT